MNTDIMLQGLRVAEIEQQRLTDRLMNEQLRIARQTRPAFSARIGLMLISIGERLQPEPAPVTGYHHGKTSMAR